MIYYLLWFLSVPASELTAAAKASKTSRTTTTTTVSTSTSVYRDPQEWANLMFCRPNPFTYTSILISAYVGVFIMFVMAVYAR